ncbi:MAG: hypothetical protein QXP65_02930 [Candidatus Hadarchaeales archaeon]
MACFLIPMALGVITTLFRKKFPTRYNINWLNALLWGGVVMLAVEHLAHGEIVPYPPFLTAGLSEVLPEMVRIGVPMALACTLLWAGMLTIAPRLNLIKTTMETRLGIRR